jgi:hypothetical protein
MTQDQQDADLSDARALAPHGVTVDRCRHESIEETALWLFTDGAQIASITRDGAAWRATRMLRGMPTAQTMADTLPAAMAYATTQTARR